MLNAVAATVEEKVADTSQGSAGAERLRENPNHKHQQANSSK
jgi:hypothetical protein